MFSDLIIPVVVVIGPALSGIIKNQIQPCSSSEFPCTDGVCVSMERLCDGVKDCADGFDETICFAEANSSSAPGDIFSRGKRQSGCRQDQWQCRDGSCIPFYGKCDGIVDCSDGSDETFPLCRHFECQEHLFRCTYGACADSTAPCNGIKECADNSDELHPSCRNETRIFTGQFKCDNGLEISATGLCDGERDCEDGSDETIKSCAGNTCVSYLLQCAYGACVDAGSYCNGKQECADGSDESDELCNRTSTISTTTATSTTSVSLSSGACVLPPYPANGKYEVRGRPSAKPGQRFGEVASVTVSCDINYEVDGSNSSILPCFGDTDLSSYMPQCKRYCALKPHRSVVYECVMTGGGGTLRRTCGEREFVGTKVEPKCRAPNYRGHPSYMHCYDSGWDHIAKCDPECGRTTPSGRENVIGGGTARHGEIPWHAGIYTKNYRPYRQICGGSLVSNNIVITAAHCFWKDFEGKQPPENYAVALGKIYRPWNDSHDEHAEFSEISKIDLPEEFRGAEVNFQNDIAVVKLEREIEYKTYIRPVCVSFEYDFNRRQLQDGMLGKIAGWGLTSADGKPASVLRVVELPFVKYETCYNESPPDFHEYITGDKICAGFRNGTALCEGDSGGGLAFPDYERGVQRYYLRGIVSTAPRNDQKCDPYQRTTFTQITKHEHFIKEHV